MDSVYTQGECVWGQERISDPKHNQKPNAIFSKIEATTYNIHYSNEYFTHVFTAQSFQAHPRLFCTLYKQIQNVLSVAIFLSQIIFSQLFRCVYKSLKAKAYAVYRQKKSFARNFIPLFISNMLSCSNKPPIKFNIIIDDIGSTK